MGGSRTVQTNEVPAYMEEAGQLAVEKAKQLYDLGKLPYMGPEVAAVNPYEAALARNVGGMASAFGLEAPSALGMSGMPTVTQGGMTGYSSYPAYIAAMEQLRDLRPDQYAYFAQMTGFNPITGVKISPLTTSQAAGAAAAAPAAVASSGDDESTADALERHYQIFPETRPKTGPYAAPQSSLMTGTASPASQAVFSQADLMGNHGGSYTSQIASDIGEFASGGGFFGAIKNAFSKNDDPSIGNVP